MHGFTLIETLVTMAILGITAAIAVMVAPAALTQSRADGALSQATNSLRLARDRALGERRNMELRFIPPDHIQIARAEIPTPPSTTVTYTVVSDVYLENHLQFLQFPEMGDTPDQFGASGPIAFGASPARLLTSEGTLVDSSGDVLNGTLFFGVPGDRQSARAVTVLGATALFRTWRWDGRRWKE